ncbi:MAG TPA: preprotein translocase subunit SecG [Gemmatimonadaceae bacterium]|nr:preprotein translocase subunit SecG [Gemmatimonadaceae bacterium]
MLYKLLIVLLIIDCLILGLAVLLQSGKGGGLAASFGGMSSSADAFLGARQAGNLLTTTSWWTGGIFIFLAFVLSLMSTRARTPESVLDRANFAPPPAGAPATTPAAPPSGAPVVPLQPAPQPRR